AQGILLALYAREKNGKGQYIDISMLHGQVSLLTYQAGIHFAQGHPPTRIGNQHPTICPYETFPASDGFFNLAIGNDKLWGLLCDLLDRSDIKSDPKFETNPKRVEVRDELFPILCEEFKKDTVDNWVSKLQDAGIPCGPILNVQQTLELEQTVARDMVVEMDHPKAGKISLTGIPIKLSGTPGEIKTPPPMHGEHTDELLKEILQMSDEELTQLREEGAI
ncbi:MAG: CoA transferase, partial [Candidatus Lindowbacteria bacterium]|nr:CoA transferase [Candidatus Lindowbacteria bacterium]